MAPKRKLPQKPIKVTGSSTPLKKKKISHPSHLSEEGVVLSFGSGDVGQLGLGDEVYERKRPTVVPLPEDVASQVIQAEAGGMHTVCVTKDGKVYSFGCNDEGALGWDTSEDGSEFNPGEVEIPEKIVQVSAGDSHTAALTDEGEVYLWGIFRDSNGPFGLTQDGVKKRPYKLPGIPTVVQIGSGNDHLCMLTDDGEIYTMGCAEQGQLGRIAECFSHRGGRKGVANLLTPMIVHFQKVRGKGKVVFEKIWCSSYCTFAKLRDGGIYAWGLNNYHHLGLEDTNTSFVPQVIDSFSDIPVESIAGGQHHTAILDTKGGVYTLGRTDYGRLGLGEGCEESHIPARVANLKEEIITQISSGSSMCIAKTKEGTAYTWGMGTYQLGTGEEEDVYEPQLLTSKQLETRKIISVSAGGQHTIILAQDK